MNLFKCTVLVALSLFLSLSAGAYERLNWQSRMLTGGRANLQSDGFIYTRVLERVNFSPEFEMNLEFLYDSENGYNVSFPTGTTHYNNGRIIE